MIRHLEELRTLVEGQGEHGRARESASSLEQRLLAWEAEHPRIVALAARVARALSQAERDRLKSWVEHYVQHAAWCLEHGLPSSRPPPV